MQPARIPQLRNRWTKAALCSYPVGGSGGRDFERMASEPTVIKKYANRRLYHTGTSSYVTLDDLAEMVKKGDEFVVIDAKTGEDITRAVLGQIIFEQESRGQHLLPLAFLRQLIRFYGDSIQTILPSYLETSLAAFTRNQGELREQMARALKGGPLGAIEEQSRRNMEMFSEAMRMWLPFGGKPAEPSSGSAQNGAARGDPASEKPQADEIEALRRQLGEIQKTIETIAQRKP
jgi:polyhydroxyalkanoate synthesis repressor PhaR